MSSDHKWVTIEIDGEDWEVSADADMVNGVRRRFTYDEAVERAKELGAQLPTCEMLDIRWRVADLKNPPHTQKLYEGDDDSELHSQLIDEDIAGFDGCPSVVGNAGKCWVVPEPADPGETPLYGWFVESQYKSWKGIKLHPSQSGETTSKVIQPYSPTAHGSTHSDYSMTGIFMRRPGSSDDDDIYESERPTSPEIVETPPAMTRPGDKGDDVRAWQNWLLSCGYALPLYGADGDHGDETEESSVEYMRDRGFAREVDDGNIVAAPPEPPAIVVDAISELPGPPDTERAPASRVEALVAQFIQARNYRKATGRQTDLIVCHSTENPLRPGRPMAQAVAGWMGGANAPMASAHFFVDTIEVIQGVKCSDIAFTAPGANKNGIHIEFVGQAMKTDWLKEGRSTLERGAELVAALCKMYDIPVVRLDVAELQAGDRGITSHRAVTDAFKKSSHQDPGGPGDKRWPWVEFLDMVRAHM